MSIQHTLCAFMAVISMAGGAAAVAETPALTIGSKAPAIKVDQWYKGKPFSTFEPGGIHVVEFWATWCGPCKKAIPHLTQLASTYKGKVSFTGICVFEEGGNIPARIRKFVTTMGDKMDFSVAGDTTDGQMAKTWVEAAGENSVPQTFIVDGAGRIAWIGHPMEVEGPLKQMIAGTYNMDAEGQKRNTEKKGVAVSEKLEKEVTDAINAKDFDKAMAKLREALVSDHPNKILLVGNVAPALFKLNESRAISEFKALLESQDGDVVGGALGTLLDSDGLSPWIYEMGIAATQKWIAAKPKYGFYWHLMAAGHFRLGNPGRARECEEKALTLLKEDPDAASEDLEEFQKALAQYKATEKAPSH